MSRFQNQIKIEPSPVPFDTILYRGIVTKIESNENFTFTFSDSITKLTFHINHFLKILFHCFAKNTKKTQVILCTLGTDVVIIVYIRVYMRMCE